MELEVTTLSMLQLYPLSPTIWEKIAISDLWGVIRKMGGTQRCNNLPVLISDGKQIVSNSEMAVELVITFSEVHSNGNLSIEMRRHSEQCLTENPEILKRKDVFGSSTGVISSLFEFK